MPVTPPSVYADAWAVPLDTLPRGDVCAALDVAAGDRVLVLGAHPDDETFGVGAGLAALSAAGVDVHVVSLTAGEAALDHVGRRVEKLAERRLDEFARACGELGAASSVVLDLPDAGLRAETAAVTTAVQAACEQHDPAHLLTVWWDDPHDDHRVVGHVALEVARQAGVRVSGFPIWAQHWSDPRVLPPRADQMTLLNLDTAARTARAAAVACYLSQTDSLADDLEPVLPASVLAWRHELAIRG